MSKEIEYVPKQVPVNEGWEGYVLASGIYQLAGGKNVLLLREGWQLSSSNIRSLQRRGVKYMEVMVEKPPESDQSTKTHEEKIESNEDDEGG